MSISAISGIVSVILGVVYSIQAFNLPRASVGSPMAPILFPLGLGILMTVFGIVILAQDFKKNGLKSKEKGAKEGFSYTAKMVTYTCVISILYALLFEPLGYVLSTIFFLEAILMVVNGKDKWKVNTIVSASFSLGIYLVFAKLLGISLPMIPLINF